MTHTTTEYHYAPIPDALLCDPTVSMLAVRVYGILMRHGLDPKSCFPSHARIAEFCGVAERSIQRPIAELEKRGWVLRVARFADSGQRITDGFHVLTTAQENAGTAQENAEVPRCDARGYRAQERDERKQVNESNGTKELVLVAFQDAPLAGSTFAEFWAAYPCKTNKRGAERAWLNAVKREKPWAIIGAAESFAADPNRDNAFTPHAASWLKDERWEDPPVRQPPGAAPLADDERGTFMAGAGWLPTFGETA